MTVTSLLLAIAIILLVGLLAIYAKLAEIGRAIHTNCDDVRKLRDEIVDDD